MSSELIESLLIDCAAARWPGRFMKSKAAACICVGVRDAGEGKEGCERRGFEIIDYIRGVGRLVECNYD